MVSGRDLRRNLLHPEGETHCLRGMEAETHTIPDEPWKAQTVNGQVLVKGTYLEDSLKVGMDVVGQRT